MVIGQAVNFEIDQQPFFKIQFVERTCRTVQSEFDPQAPQIVVEIDYEVITFWF